MPDTAKIEGLRGVGWKKARSCATCVHTSTGGRVRFGYCLHPEASYVHAKQGPRKLPSHAGACCSRYEAAPVPGLDELVELVEGGS